MSYQVLARKWRPRSFADMVGQGHVLRVLINALDSDRLHHAYLFSGTRGVGKTTLARILAKCLNCEAGVSSAPCGECGACTGIDEGRFVDLIEVDAASRSKVDETRELMDNVQYSPSAGRYKVYLIDEVHMFSKSSFNALLKTLEEPPPHVKFLLATTEPKRIPITILSRCLQFNLKHLSTEQIESQLKTIAEQEGIFAEDTSLHLLAAAADGSMRDALSLLDQAISYGNGRLEADQVGDMLGTLEAADLSGLIESLGSRDAGAMFAGIEKMAQLAPDYDAVLAELLSLLHDMAVAQTLPPDSDLVSETVREGAGRLSREDVQLYYQIALNGRRDLPMAPDPKTGFEMTMIRMLAFRPLDGTRPGNSGADTRSRGAEIRRGVAPSPKPAGPPPSPKPAGPPPEPAAASAPAEDQNRAQGKPVPSPVDNDSWHALVEAMGLKGLTGELAGSCAWKNYEENRLHLTLQFAQEYLLETGEQERLQEALREHLGADTRLTITAEEAQGEAPKQRKSREALEAKQAALETIEKDPGVRAVIDTFDARIDKEATGYMEQDG